MNPSPDIIRQIRTKAMALVAARELSQWQLQQKLAQLWPATECKPVIDAVLQEFVEHGWQDDERTTQMLLQAAQRRHWGPVRIRHELRERGLEHPTLANSDAPWVDAAVALLLRRFGSGVKTVEVAIELKMLRYLARQGYTHTQCRTALAYWRDSAADTSEI